MIYGRWERPEYEDRHGCHVVGSIVAAVVSVVSDVVAGIGGALGGGLLAGGAAEAGLAGVGAAGAAVGGDLAAGIGLGAGLGGAAAEALGGSEAAGGAVGGDLAAGAAGGLLGAAAGPGVEVADAGGLVTPATGATTSLPSVTPSVGGFGSAAPAGGISAGASAPVAPATSLATDPGTLGAGTFTSPTAANSVDLAGTAGTSGPAATAANLGVGNVGASVGAPGLNQVPGGFVATDTAGGSAPASGGNGIGLGAKAADVSGVGASPGGAGGILKTLGLTPLQAGGVGLTGLSLLRSLMADNTATAFAPGQVLTNQANQLSAQGQQLGSYLQTGSLPPGAQAAIDQATASAKAQIRSAHAASGTTGSTMEAQDLANVDQQAAAYGFKIADQLLSQGISESQISEQIFQSLLGTDVALNAQVGQGVANLATSLGGGVRLNLGNTGVPVTVQG